MADPNSSFPAPREGVTAARGASGPAPSPDRPAAAPAAGHHGPHLPHDLPHGASQRIHDLLHAEEAEGLPDAVLDTDPAPAPPPPVGWHDVAGPAEDVRAAQASLAVKSSIVARAGRLALASGTGGYRVRQILDRVSSALKVECRADVTLMSIDLTVTDGPDSFTEVVSLTKTGVNTERIWRLEGFVCDLEKYAANLTVAEVHGMLDDIESRGGRYSAVQSGVAAAFACCAFVFLLGGGPVEMLCAGVGAGVGQWLRKVMLERHINQFATTMAAVAVACLLYLAALAAVSLGDPAAMGLHEGGYIGAMLFVIPGFPLITSGLDIAKMDLASGLERLAYAVCVIAVATLSAWFVAKVVTLQPAELVAPELPALALALLRVVASFVGVFGFSVLFNSTPRMAAAAGAIGAVANTARLELIDLAGLTPEAGALVGALLAGLVAGAVALRVRMPRISLTVPSIVIMVPGLYLYQAMYYMCDFDVVSAMGWAMRAMVVIACLPIGLALARVLTDANWRYDR